MGGRPSSPVAPSRARFQPAAALLRLWRTARGRLQHWRWYTPDRHVLEHVILPALRERPDVRRILFVGCDWYTRRYPDRFGDREMWTLDVDPDRARYGAPRHAVGSFAEVRRHFAPGSLDAIVCNGVLGWGVDSREDTEAALAQSYECLRPGGILIIGWNDLEGVRPVPLESIEALRRFEPFAMPPFPAPRYPTFSDLEHHFWFYRRPREGERGELA